MLRCRLTPEALGRTRFGFAPLTEVPSSARALVAAQPPVILREWVAETRSRLTRRDRELLAAVIPPSPRHRVPRFLHAAPASGWTPIEEQVEGIRRLPHERVAPDLVEAWGPGGCPPLTRELVRAPDLPARVAELVWRYWQVAIAPYWTRMAAVLERDRDRRILEAGAEGLTATVSRLHPTVSAQGEWIRVDKPYVDAEILGPTPVLVPSVFVWPGLGVAPYDGRFDILYGADGVGRVWESLGATYDDRDALAGLVGRGRASVLLRLETPMTTTELARQLGISPAGVSGHLGVLGRSRLVSAQRRGREVFYRRTDLGDSLVRSSGPRGSHPSEVR